MKRRATTRPIDVGSNRAGAHPGTHEIGFDSAADTITLRHTARSREGLARGALQGGAVDQRQERFVTNSAKSCLGMIASKGEVVHVYGMRHGSGYAVPAAIWRSTSATLRRLVRRQIEAGINFLVPCGTTGESPTLSRAEHLRVVEITWKKRKGKVPVLAGAGGYNTREVIELAQELERMGVDGILSVTPYYNKPTQEGLYQHYKAIAAAVRMPMVVYSVQGRTGVNVEPATLARLAADREHRGREGSVGQHRRRSPTSCTRCRERSPCFRAMTRSRCR